MSNKADVVTDRDQKNPQQQNSIVYDLASPNGAENFCDDISGPSSEGGSKKQPEKEVYKSSTRVALAHSGGGLRVATTSIGILRALHQKKIKNSDGNLVPAMHAIKYNSGISGGTIPAALYTYAQVPTSELLEVERTCDPSELTKETLNYIPKGSMAQLFTKKKFRITPSAIVRFFACILNPKTLFFSLTNIVKYHSYMSGLVFYALCKPLKIPRNKFFVSGREAVDKIMSDQSSKGCFQKKLKEKDFLLPRSDVKTLPMILWTLNGERADLNNYMNNYKRLRNEAWDEYKVQETLQFFSGDYEGKERPNMTEIIKSLRNNHEGCLPIPFIGTPSAVWAPHQGVVTFNRKKRVQFPMQGVAPWEWGTRSRFSVEKMIALSTNFAGMGGGKDDLKTDLVAQNLTNIRRIKLGDEFKGTMMMADGGTNDLLGILPVIQEGACDKIISIFNYNKHLPYCEATTPYSTIFDKAPCLDENDPKLEKHFEEWLKMISPFFACYFGFFGTSLDWQANILNHVFKDEGLIHLKKMMLAFNSLYMAGEPLIYTLKDLETIDNPFWGIKAGRKIEITMIYFHMPKNFSSKLPQDLNTMTRTGRLDTGDEDLDCVPELPWSNTGYNENQINMMNALGNWMVLRAWDGLKGHSGEEVFEGFSKILSLTDEEVVEKDEKEVTTWAKQSLSELICSMTSTKDLVMVEKEEVIEENSYNMDEAESK